MSCCNSLNGYGSMLNGEGPMLSGRSKPYYIGVAGLGQFDPGTITASVSAIDTAVTDAKSAWDALEAALGIGAGRREADVIVPVQNKIVETIIAPVSDYLTSINNGTHTPTCNELQMWLGAVTQAKRSWDNFLYNTTWQDGRAAQQAAATLQPYWTNATNDLNKYITQYCTGISATIGSIFTTPTGQTNWPVIGLLAVGTYFLVGRRKSK